MEKVDGKKIRDRSDKFKDFYSPARSFYNSMSEPEKQHIIIAFHFEVGKVESEEVRQKIVDQFADVDKELAIEIAKGVGVSPPSNGADSTKSDNFPSFSMENTVKDTVKSRKVAILAENGFNYDELMKVKDALKDAGANSEIISMYRGTIKADNGKKIEVNKNYISTASTQFDAVYVPGGKESVESLKTRGDVIHFVNEAFKHCKAIAAVGEGVELFKESDITGVAIAGDGEVTSDKGVITSINGTNMDNFTKSFIKAIAMHHHGDRENETVPAK